jgi:CHAD domain-containing protein
LAEGLQRIAREQIARVMHDFSDEQCAIEERVHSLRARCKKLRALLLLPGPLMGAAFAVEDDRLRTAGKRLGAVRDAHSRAQRMRALGAPGLLHAPYSDEDAAAVEQSLADLRMTLAAIDDWPLPVHGFCDIAPGFARTYRNCVDSWSSLRQEASDANYHRLRKWTKNHWYQVRILERINRSTLRDRREGLRRLGALLGDAHDLVVLLETSQGSIDGKLTTEAKRRKKKLYARAQKSAQKLFASHPDALLADMAGWWAQWRGN